MENNITKIALEHFENIGVETNFSLFPYDNKNYLKRQLTLNKMFNKFINSGVKNEKAK